MTMKLQNPGQRFLAAFKRGAFFSICLTGVLAAPFMTLAENKPKNSIAGEVNSLPNFPIVRTTAVNRPVKVSDGISTSENLRIAHFNQKSSDSDTRPGL